MRPAVHRADDDRGAGILRLVGQVESRNAHAAADPPRHWIVRPFWEVVVARARAADCGVWSATSNRLRTAWDMLLETAYGPSSS